MIIYSICFNMLLKTDIERDFITYHFKVSNRQNRPSLDATSIAQRLCHKQLNQRKFSKKSLPINNNPVHWLLPKSSPTPFKFLTIINHRHSSRRKGRRPRPDSAKYPKIVAATPNRLIKVTRCTKVVDTIEIGYTDGFRVLIPHGVRFRVLRVVSVKERNTVTGSRFIAAKGSITARHTCVGTCVGRETERERLGCFRFWRAPAETLFFSSDACSLALSLFYGVVRSRCGPRHCARLPAVCRLHLSVPGSDVCAIRCSQFSIKVRQPGFCFSRFLLCERLLRFLL